MISVSRLLRVCILVLSLFCLDGVLASGGDQSYFFQRCLAHCFERKCHDIESFRSKQSMDLRLLGWTCEDECEYTCMWPTVEAFKKDKLPTPQFHGKWPFVRVLGVQEPASVIFSILNFLAHLSIFKFRRDLPSSAPMYTVWTLNSMVALNAWFWSTVFHTRDTPFTEMMDYFCAFSLVLTNLLALVCRVLGEKQVKEKVAVLVVTALLFAYHVGYLALVKFDYGYNMKVNIAVGMCNLLGWLYWCHVNRRRRYVYKCAFVMVGTASLTALEIFDFPPIYWALDAHSLWHFGTAPLTLVWMSFITSDTRHLVEEKLTLDGRQELKKAM